MTGAGVLWSIALLLGTYLETKHAQECEAPCSKESCSRPLYGPCCKKVNIALGSQHTKQSSDYQGHNSSLAVDGDTDNDFNRGTCTHTDDPDLRDAYWMINLESTYNISEIKLYLRSDNAKRYDGLRVLVGSTECFRLKGSIGEVYTPHNKQIQQIHCRPPLPGSLVSVHIDIGMLTLCEVQIFACTPGWYGEECDKRCNCRDSGQCDQRTGWCGGGCRAGKHGDGCQCDCADGRYGVECRESCGRCKEGTVCDKTNGTCHSGCEQEYMGDLCQECDESYHLSGDSCEACGLCEDSEPCNVTTGFCAGNCQAGYQQPFCKDECDHGTFGINCQSTCGQCFGNQTCNNTDGICHNGCLEHFVPPMCTECDEGWFGTNCLSQCGKCLGDQVCENTDGTCTDGCVDHFTPPICTECVDGMCGMNCDRTCGRCLGDSPCNKTTGVCHNGCSSGFEPQMCDDTNCSHTDCIPGRYGPDCESTCGQCADNATCSRNGTCPRGCLAGFTDRLCQTLIAGESPDMVPMAGGVAAAIVIIIIIIIVVIVFLKRRRLQRKPQTTVSKINEKHKDTSFINISDPAVPKQVTKQNNDTSNSAEVPSKSLKSKKEPKECPSNTQPEQKADKTAKKKQEPLVEEKPEVKIAEPSGDGNEYYSVIPAPITLPKLAQYIKDRLNSVGFENEFKLLPYGIFEDHDEGKKPENKKKNRFLKLYPYNHSRVVLTQEGDADSDYINASYINGYRDAKTFIAAQGPNPVTVDDFWRMVWQENVTKIVMVTRLMELAKKKCEQYWPDDKETIECGHVRVHHEYSTVRRDYTIRTFKVKHAEEASESREVSQLHFTSWSDHDVPSAPALVSFWKQFRNLHQEQDTGPVVVHCSAGVGRTGTFIGLDLLLEEAEREKRVNVFSCVHQMRKARMNMVQTASQYGFLHEVVLEAVQSRNTFYTSTEFDLMFGTGNSYTDDQEREVQRQFEILTTMRKQFTDKQLSDARLPENINKNRSLYILPENKSKPYLMTPVQGRNQYINAVVLPSYASQSGLIATQTPLPDTVVDFWRLVYDHDIVNIVCLEDHEMVYPSKDAPLESGPFQISIDKGWERRSSFAQTQISLAKIEEPEEEREITVYRASCARPSDLLECVNEMETRDVLRQGQLLVHCNNGSDLCGLFCGVLNIITRLRLDREVDIFLDIRELQSIRPSFIHSLDQYRFCFDAVKEYERSTSIYANV